MIKQANKFSYPLIILLVLFYSNSQSIVPFQTITGNLPGNVYKISVIQGDIIKVSIGSFPLSLATITAQNPLGTGLSLTSTSTSYNPFVYTGTVPSTVTVKTDIYLIVQFADKFIDYQIRIQVNGGIVYFGNGLGSNVLGSIAHRILVNNPCKFNLNFTTTYSSAKIYLYYSDKSTLVTLTGTNTAIQSLVENITISSIKTGIIYILLQPNSGTLTALSGYTLAITTFCDTLCLNDINYFYKTSCTLCGDGILAVGESCDNGNKPGCSSNCIVDANYICYGSIGTSSYCSKNPICGDNIVDNGEECDNGNKTGCTTACKLDPNFKCSKQIGKPSVCQKCGDSIVAGDEACDNGNQVGCSKDCKVDTGYQCWGSPSFCWRKNPICGNGVIEVAEQCDDGNNIDGDGCSRWCRVQSSYNCTGNFGQKSSCSKVTVPVITCGNQVFQPVLNSNGLIQQCDNGNKTGCINCTIDLGWFCSSSPGFKSYCFQVYIPKCGNGRIDSGQGCDDGNINNGDGCNSFCQKQFVPPPPPPPPGRLGTCGDGSVQAPWQECDLGFPIIPSLGCNFKCQVVSGWQCPPPGRSCFRI